MSSNGWSKNKLDKILLWKAKAKLYSIGHAQSSEYFLWVAFVVNSLVAALSGAGTTGSVLVASNTAGIDLTLTGVISACCTGLATCVSVYNSIYNPNQTAADHREVAKEYQNMVIDIDTELAKDVHERLDGTHFLGQIAEQIKKLTSGSVSIPIHQWNNLVKQARSIRSPEPNTSPVIRLTNIPAAIELPPRTRSVSPKKGELSPDISAARTGNSYSHGDSYFSISRNNGSHVVTDSVDIPEPDSHKIPVDITKQLEFQLNRYG